MRKLVGLYYLAVWRKARDEISSCITQEGEAAEGVGARRSIVSRETREEWT